MSRRARLLLVVLLAALVSACWSLAADETRTDPCATGYGGDDGVGGEGGGGVGGSDVGTGVGGSDVGVGSSSADVGVGAGAGSSSSDVSVGAGGFSARPVPHRMRRRRLHRRGGLGTAQEAVCPQAGNVISYFRTNQFLPFVTTVPDDGEGPAGGWQQWSGVLTLADGITDVYSCSVTIGMPLRTSAIGMIPSFVAAHYSAEVANEAADALWPTPLPQGIFCTRFINQMQTLFGANLSSLGARVTP